MCVKKKKTKIFVYTCYTTICTCEKTPSPVDYVSIPMLIRACVCICQDNLRTAEEIVYCWLIATTRAIHPSSTTPCACVLREAYPITTHVHVPMYVHRHCARFVFPTGSPLKSCVIIVVPINTCATTIIPTITHRAYVHGCHTVKNNTLIISHAELYYLTILLLLSLSLLVNRNTSDTGVRCVYVRTPR